MFCRKCGGLMLPKEGMLTCTRCGHKQEIVNKEVHTRVERRGGKKKKLLVLDEDADVTTLPVTRAECPKCRNMEAYWWLIQTRRADEPETRFLRCTKCKHTWREYD
ncbi:MAG: transcription factor S [Methanobacteriota archaeon]|nr:MAG: transcription factor S [Euryarchaeota archaeon]